MCFHSFNSWKRYIKPACRVRTVNKTSWYSDSAILSWVQFLLKPYDSIFACVGGAGGEYALFNQSTKKLWSFLYGELFIYRHLATIFGGPCCPNSRMPFLATFMLTKKELCLSSETSKWTVHNVYNQTGVSECKTWSIWTERTLFP